MTINHRMPSRRAFLLSTAAVGVLAATTTGCQEAPTTDRQLVFASLANHFSAFDIQ